MLYYWHPGLVWLKFMKHICILDCRWLYLIALYMKNIIYVNNELLHENWKKVEILARGKFNLTKVRPLFMLLHRGSDNSILITNHVQ